VSAVLRHDVDFDDSVDGIVPIDVIASLPSGKYRDWAYTTVIGAEISQRSPSLCEETVKFLSARPHRDPDYSERETLLDELHDGHRHEISLAVWLEYLRFDTLLAELTKELSLDGKCVFRDREDPNWEPIPLF
jgi:hypothetical protein